MGHKVVSLLRAKMTGVNTYFCNTQILDLPSASYRVAHHAAGSEIKYMIDGKKNCLLEIVLRG
jgi:hypothetical protein